MRSKNKQELAYDVLRERIEHLEYAPSQRLVIDSLAKELGISQVPIREAIRRLEAEGLVIYSANSGPVVAPASKEDWMQLMESLAVLEGYATAQAAKSLKPSDIKQLRAINEKMKVARADIDFEMWTSKNREFHELIHSRCQNKVIVDEIIRIRRRSDTVSRISFARERGVIIHTLGMKAGDNTIERHEEIIKAIEADRPAAEIEFLTRQHVLDPVNEVRLSLNAEPTRQRLKVAVG